MPEWVYRYRGWLASPPLLFALFSSRGATQADWLVWPLGVGVVLLGMGLRVWAQQHIRHRLRVPMELTTAGPFQFVRNPLYIGNTLLGVGATFASALLWVVPVTLVWFLAIYTLVVRREEAELAARYGEPYRQYLRDVPRWFPRRIRFGNSGLINEYFGRAVVAELHCLLILLPYLLKEFGPRWLGGAYW